MKNSIVKRIYTVWKIQLDSPMNVSGGENIVTDADLQRNGSGEIFLPGTSLAGAFRSYLDLKKDEAGIFGYSDDKKGFMSKVFISDVYFAGEPKTSIRDGICLGEDRIVKDKGKFDQEIVETGAEGMLYLECIIRKEDQEQEILDGIHRIAWGIQNGEIRFGAKKTRGFGKVKILEIYERSFTEETRADWLSFLRTRNNLNVYEKVDVDVYINDREEYKRKYLKITVPLRQKGGISIRRYSAQPDKADFEHITCNNKSVIPGSSWNGAIRSAAVRILKDLDCKNIDSLLDVWFGYVRNENAPGQERKPKAGKSMVTVSESIITDPEDGKVVRIPISRNRINRFDSSTVNGALYSEIACFNGHTELEFYVYKNEDYLALIGLLQLIIKDIQSGFLAIGGQTAVGRGIFAEDGEIHYSEEIDEKLCQRELCSILRYRQ